LPSVTGDKIQLPQVILNLIVNGIEAMAVALSAFQLALFLFVVWIPIVAAGSKDPFQWSETILNMALLAGAWVVAESYW
jgi:hypothetical protein